MRSVNHRFLDLHLRVPEGFEPLEPRIRQIVRERVRRGHLDVTLRYELAGPAAVAVNQEVAASYLRAVEDLRKQFGVKTEPDLAAILRLPGVIGASAGLLRPTTISRASNQRSLAASRRRSISSTHARAGSAALCSPTCPAASPASRASPPVSRVLAERARPAFARRLELRLKELLGEASIDPARLAQEAALAAERSDVSEELARLASHVRQFESLLAGASDVGKKLDFLLQEMQREANTLLSKTPGNEAEGLEITELALEIKSEIEKLREQVQNIE